MKILILIMLFYNSTVFSSLYDDYISGELEIDDMLVINPDITDYVGPLSGNIYLNGGDKGFGYEPNLIGGVSASETEFLSFELQTQNLFQDEGMHLVAALRGHSSAPVPLLLRGRGLAMKDTPNCNEGIAIEDFTISAEGGGDGYYLKGCKHFTFANYTTYRIDIHASLNVIAYWVFKQNSLHLQIIFGAPPWSLVATGGCTSTPYTSCNGHPSDVGGQNVIIGTAFRSSPSFDYTLSNVYIAKW